MPNFWKKLPKPFLVLAPMDDVTDVVFRTIVEETAKPDVFFTEFTSADALCSPGQEVAFRKLKFTKSQKPIVAQIWGSNPTTLFQSAKIIQNLGFDGIDINMGCPVRAVMKKGAGAGQIIKYENAKECLDALKKGAPKLPISVKTRLGVKTIETEDWIGFLLQQNLSAITIHCRIAKQLSKGEANWEEIGKAVKLRNKYSSETIIVGNGDIQSYEEAIKMHQIYGVDGIMIGRGIFSNPWIFSKKGSLKKHTKDEYLALLVKHIDLYTKTWGKNKNFEKMKKFFKMYVKDFKGANELRIKLMECTNNEEAKQILS